MSDVVKTLVFRLRSLSGKLRRLFVTAVKGNTFNEEQMWKVVLIRIFASSLQVFEGGNFLVTIMKGLEMRYSGD